MAAAVSAGAAVAGMATQARVPLLRHPMSLQSAYARHLTRAVLQVDRVGSICARPGAHAWDAAGRDDPTAPACLHDESLQSQAADMTGHEQPPHFPQAHTCSYWVSMVAFGTSRYIACYSLWNGPVAWDEGGTGRGWAPAPEAADATKASHLRTGEGEKVYMGVWGPW